MIAIALFFKPQTKLTVGIYACAALAGLFLFEIFLTAQSFSMHMSNLGKLTQDQREQTEQISDFTRGFALPSANQKAGVTDLSKSLLSGFPGSNVLLCAPDGETYVYKADRYGFNNPDKIYDEGIDVVVVGDSFVEGFCLPPGQDFVSRMRGEGINVAGLGIRGNGPVIELATLGRFGPTLKPKTIIMAFFEGNDWKNFGRDLRTPWMMQALSDTPSFGPVEIDAETEKKARAFTQNMTDKDIEPLDVFRKTSLLRNFFALHMTSSSLGLIYPKAPPDLPQYADVLKKTIAVADQWGGTAHLLYIPEVGRATGVIPNGFVFDQTRDKVLAAAEEAGMNVIDLVPAFEADGNSVRFYAADAHFSEEGAAFVGRHIAKVLRDLE